MKKIVLIVGARPNFMKAFPVYEALKNDFDLTLIHTGQHFDEKMSDIFFNQLGFPKPNIHFDLESKSRAGELDDLLYVNNSEYLKDKNKAIQELLNYSGKKLGQLGEIRDKLIKNFEEIKPDLIIVFGDVTSTLSAALSAKKLGIEIAHVESGLRSGDLSMPEEVNRILTDTITNYYFITEQSGVDNLKKEGLDNENLYLVGNTMIDCLFMFKDKALSTKYNEVLGVKEKEYVLITLHRPSNVDNLDKLKEITQDIIKLSKTEKIIFPIHPRTKKSLEKLELLDKMNNIIICEPLGYLEFTCLEANAKYIVTDSGGIQEETTALNVPCFTLRENTERPSTLIDNGGTNQLIDNIGSIKFKDYINKELWNGKSNINIFNKIIELKIKKNLGITKKELNLYINELKENFDIPIKYIDNNLLNFTLKKQVQINNKIYEIKLPDLWTIKESTNTLYQIHTLNQIIQSQISLFLYKKYDLKILKECIEIIINWFNNNNKIKIDKFYKENNLNWQDMSSAYRLCNILLVYELSKKFNINIDDNIFQKEILFHIKWLKLHIEYQNRLNTCSNHSLFSSKNLILGYLIYNKYFTELDIEYIDIAINQFLFTISKNVNIVEFLSKEHSTNYHVLYYRQIEKILRLLNKSKYNTDKLKIIFDNMYNNLNYFIYPNNEFVQIGDTDIKISNLKFNTNLGKIKLFKNTGYAIYKNLDIYISLSSSYHSKYHKHIDELSINYYNKYPILIEGGRYSYDDYNINNIYEPIRNNYYLSQRSKNSIVIDDNYFSFRKIEEKLNNNEYKYGSGIYECKIINNEIFLIGNNPLLYKMQNINHNRQVIYDETNLSLKIEDIIISKDNLNHTCTRHFHFHQDWELLEIINNVVLFKHKKDNLLIHFEDKSHGIINRYYGQEQPFIQGFTSPSEYIKIPINALEIKNTFKYKIELKCIIKLETFDIYNNKINTNDNYDFIQKKISSLDEIIKNNKIHYVFKDIHFLFYNNTKNNNLVISFHGSVDKQLKKDNYVFRGYNYLIDDTDLLCISDGLNTVYDFYEIGWYLSTKKYNFDIIYREIFDYIIQKFKNYKNIIFTGSSMGGYPSLFYAGIYNSISLISNSQIYIENHSRYHKDFKNKLEKYNDEPIHINGYINQHLMKYIPKHIYVCNNKLDYTYKKHTIPFINYFKEKINISTLFFEEGNSKIDYHKIQYPNSLKHIDILKKILLNDKSLFNNNKKK